jgi:hypothetical protein
MNGEANAHPQSRQAAEQAHDRLAPHLRSQDATRSSPRPEATANPNSDDSAKVQSMRRHALAATAGLLLTRCSLTPLPEDFGTCEAETPVDSPNAAPTYHADIRPILAARCVSCHVDGGVAPFSLTTYAQAHDFRDVIANATSERRMPPWPPGRCCGEFRHDRSLTPEQLALLETWAENDAPEGAPADAAPDPEIEEGLSRSDLEIEMPAPYTPERPRRRRPALLPARLADRPADPHHRPRRRAWRRRPAPPLARLRDPAVQGRDLPGARRPRRRPRLELPGRPRRGR